MDSESNSAKTEQIDMNLSEMRREDLLKNRHSSLLMFVPMGVEGERLKDQEAKRVVGIWGVQVARMFYDQQFKNLVAVVLPFSF